MSHETETSLESQDDEAHWLDYIENELDDSLKEDLEIVLKNSSEKMQQLKELERVKQGIQLAGEMDLPSDEQYYKDLHARIMEKVQQTEIEKNPSDKNFLDMSDERGVSRLPLYMMVGGIAALFVAVISVMNIQRQSNIEKNIASETPVVQDWLLKASAENPQEFSESLISVNSEEDLVSAAAEKKLDNLSDEELKKVISRILDGQQKE